MMALHRVRRAEPLGAVGTVRRGRCGGMERPKPDRQAVALDLVRRVVAESRGPGFDELRAAALIVLLVAHAVDEEREECAMIAEVLEPPGPETISDLIRSRG